MEAGKLILKRDAVMTLTRRIRHQVMQIEGVDKSVVSALDAFRRSFRTDIDPKIETALLPLPPRTAKNILRQIEADEKVTPETMNELKRLLRQR